jgi:omega-hydroxy-beta-dihydromenaquinone-9 sulfotransferase
MPCSMKISFLYGMESAPWWRLLKENRFAVSLRYLPNAASISLMSMVNSWLARRDRLVDCTDTEIRPPLFILGHWRSGTTHLHYLLDQDPGLCAPNTYQVCYPSSFLRSEESHGGKLAHLVPEKRPQDNMPMSMKTPNEDEIALAALGLPSPYLGWAFPDRSSHYLRFLSFQDATGEETEAWKSGFTAYLRRLSHGHSRRLVIKSPTHTARLKLLLELFPDARFIHIHRDPYTVFQSSLHLYRTWERQFAFLQRPDMDAIEDYAIDIYREMYQRYFEDLHLVPEGNLHTLAFESLERDPMAAMEEVYGTLGLPGFPAERFGRYLAGVSEYRKNEHRPLEARQKERIAREWGFAFEKLGYPT